MKISVLISTYNEEKHIENCLTSLKNQTYKNFEIVVCDAYSKDRTTEIAKKYADKIIFVKKTMIGIQKNAGVKACKGDYVVLSDADCTHPKDWIARIAGFLKKHPETDVYGGIDIPRKNDPLFERCVFAFDSNDKTITDSFKAAWRLRGCNIVYRKKSFLALGGYDKELSGSEEPELHTRMAKKGYDLYFDKTLFVYHRRRSNIKDLFKQMFRNGVSSGKIFRKRSDMFRYYDFMSIGYVFYLIFSLILLAIKPLLGLELIVLALLPMIYYSFKAMRKSRIMHFELMVPIIFTKAFAYGLGIIYGFTGFKLTQGIKF